MENVHVNYHEKSLRPLKLHISSQIEDFIFLSLCCLILYTGIVCEGLNEHPVHQMIEEDTQNFGHLDL
jgi:hypothetical protein